MSIQSDLLRDLADRYAPGPTLVLGGEAALANALGRDGTYVPIDIRERDLASGRVISEPDAAAYASVLLPAPPDRSLLRRHLLTAAYALGTGGTLVIAGANAEGGKSAIADAADLFGQPAWSGYREKHRMAIFRQGQALAPAWATEPGIAPGTWATFTISTPVGPILLQTQAGVFAGAKLDAGTRLLLENMDIPGGGRVLDLGCGMGVIGISAARSGAGLVTMTDANLLAVEAARRNADVCEIAADVVASDVFTHLGDARFDAIISNPPFHRGKAVDFSVSDRLITEAPAHLHPGGSLLVVANAFLAYHHRMEQIFPRVEIVARTPQYHVIRAF